jgi:hypothetical protein
MGKTTKLAIKRMAQIKAMQESEIRQKKDLRELGRAATKAKKGAGPAPRDVFVAADSAHKMLSKWGIPHYVKLNKRIAVTCNFYYDEEGVAPDLYLDVELILRPSKGNPNVTELILNYESEEGDVICRGAINPAKPNHVTLTSRTPVEATFHLTLGMVRSLGGEVVLDGKWRETFKNRISRTGQCQILVT